MQGVKNNSKERLWNNTETSQFSLLIGPVTCGQKHMTHQFTWPVSLKCLASALQSFSWPFHIRSRRHLSWKALKK